MSSRTGIASRLPESQSLVDRATHAVRRAILEGRCKPGETLSISDLATDLGVSHSPVREALQRLSGQGLILLRPARTAVVAPLELGDLEEIYRLRLTIETEACARAGDRLTGVQLAALEHQFEAMSGLQDDADRFWDEHTAFHKGLMAPVLTPRLDRMLSELWHAAERYIRIVYVETDVLFTHPVRERHQPLLDAARARDGERLREAIGVHLRSNLREISDSLQQILPPPPS